MTTPNIIVTDDGDRKIPVLHYHGLKAYHAEAQEKQRFIVLTLRRGRKMADVAIPKECAQTLAMDIRQWMETEKSWPTMEQYLAPSQN